MISISIDFSEVLKTLNIVDNVKNLNNLENLVDNIARLISLDLRKRFQSSPITTTGGMVYGNVFWQKLKPSTLKSNPNRIGKKILIDTGRLRDSLILPDIGNNFIELSRKNTRLSYSSLLDYAVPNNELRQFMFITDETIGLIIQEILDWKKIIEK